MSKHKNLILICIAAILFIYAGFISIYPGILNSTFNINDFEKKFYEATSLETTIESVDFKIKPNFETIINIYGFDLKYIDRQDLFSARTIEIVTTPSALFSNNYKIKSMNLKTVKYNDQVLETGENKLAFLPASFNPKPFGKNTITVSPGNITIKNAKYSYTKSLPYTYKEDSYAVRNYSAAEVKSYLSSLNFAKVKIK